jgi:O-antigen/teichoic acid export membrane protein
MGRAGLPGRGGSEGIVGVAPGRPSPAARSGAGRGTGDGAGQTRLAEVARGGTLNLAGAAVATVATVGVTVLVTRQFSKPVAGAFFTAISAFIIVEAVAGLGANTGLVYFIARLRSLGEENRIPAILRAAVVPVLALSVAAAFAMLLLAGPLAHVLLSGHMGRGAAGPAAVADGLRVLAVAIPFAALVDTLLGATRGYHEMRPTVVVDRMGVPTAQLIGVLIAVAAGSATLLAPLWALPNVAGAAAAWLWLHRIRRDPRPRRAPLPDILPDVPPELAALLALATPVPSRNRPRSRGTARPGAHGTPAGSRIARKQLANADPRGFWRFTTPRALASLTSVILQRLDIVLVAIIIGPGAAAVYTAATRFLVVGQFGNMAISRAAQPRFTELFTVGDRRSANVVYQATTAWLILLNWPLYLLAVVYGPEVLTIFGHSYSAGNATMVILGFSMLLGTACGQVDMVLITSGRSSWSLANGLLAMGVNVGLDLVLIPRYGITGAAVGWALAMTVSNLVPLAQLAAAFRLHPFGRGSLIACALSALSFGVIPLAVRAGLGGGAAALAVGVVAGCALQAAGLWRFRGPLRLGAMPVLSSLRARRRSAPRAQIGRDPL